jgi:hypothetical protein
VIEGGDGIRYRFGSGYEDSSEAPLHGWAARGGSAASGLGAVGRACKPLAKGGEEVSDEYP